MSIFSGDDYGTLGFANVVTDTWVLNHGDSAGQTVNEANPTIHASGTLTVQDVDGTDNVTLSTLGVALNFDGNTVAAADLGLSDIQLLSDFTIPTGNVLSGPATATQFNWSFDATGSAFDFLTPSDTLTLQYTIRPDDGHGTTTTGDGVVTITINGTNDAPVVTAGSTLSYTENDAATAIAPAATVTDVDSTDFNGGSLTAAFTANGGGEDQLVLLTDADVDGRKRQHRLCGRQ